VRWFLPLHGDLREGGSFQLEGNAGGDILTCTPPQLLRVTFGHLTSPTRLKEILAEHVAYADEMQRKAAKDAKWSAADPAWAYARVALSWAERYYANERELALKMIKELDEAEAVFPGEVGRREVPWPAPEFWYEIEKRADADDSE